MIWLYRLQQRLAITRNEGLAILTLAGLLALGLVAQHGQQQKPVHDPSTYAKMEARFQAHVTALPGANRAASGPERHQAERRVSGREQAGRININTASSAELRQLPGIGPTLSTRIEAYRSTHGPFVRVDDIMHVHGIGEKTLAQLRSMLYVENEKKQ